MSERSELQKHGPIFGAQRRSGHWCPAETVTVNHVHDSEVHQ